jgi:hypothetical protein
MLLAFGCSSVTTVQPLPWKIEPADQDKFEGTWLLGGGALQIRFAETGVARFAGLDWEDGQFQLERGEMTICHGEELDFLSVRTEEGGAWMDRYYLVQYRFTDEGDLVLWLPNPEAFAEAIAHGRLEGTVEGGDCCPDATITSQPDTLLELIDDADDRELFDYREPMILRRVTVWHSPAEPAEPIAEE